LRFVNFIVVKFGTKIDKFGLVN